jgi:hypothetical protein
MIAPPEGGAVAVLADCIALSLACHSFVMARIVLTEVVLAPREEGYMLAWKVENMVMTESWRFPGCLVSCS